jgi:hypothetical protein
MIYERTGAFCGMRIGMGNQNTKSAALSTTYMNIPGTELGQAELEASD